MGGGLPPDYYAYMCVHLASSSTHQQAMMFPFSRHGGDGLTVGLDDLRGLFQP